MTVGVAAALQILSDDLTVLGGARSTWTTTWASTGTTNPAKGNGTFTGRYLQAGKLVIFSLSATMGSTTTYGGTDGAWTFTLPVAARTNTQFGFFGTATDVSATTDYPIAFQVLSTTLMAGRAWTGASAAFQAIRSTQPFAWATGDTLAISGVYESA